MIAIIVYLVGVLAIWASFYLPSLLFGKSKDYPGCYMWLLFFVWTFSYWIAAGPIMLVLENGFIAGALVHQLITGQINWMQFGKFFLFVFCGLTLLSLLLPKDTSEKTAEEERIKNLFNNAIDKRLHVRIAFASASAIVSCTWFMKFNVDTWSYSLSHPVSIVFGILIAFAIIYPFRKVPKALLNDLRGDKKTPKFETLEEEPTE